MTPAERQRAYRARQGARVGGRRGPEPVEPCGTLAAYRRHKRNGEPIDQACRDEYNRQHRDYYAARRRSETR